MGSYGEQLSFEPGRGWSFSMMCRICEMTIPEGLHFLSPARQHVKENIFSPDEDDPLNYRFTIPYTTGLVLTGGELTEVCHCFGDPALSYRRNVCAG